MRFVNIVSIAHFHELIPGQPAPAYKDNKIIGHPIIPKELGEFISDPQFSDVYLWWVTNTGIASPREVSIEEFRFSLTSNYGIGFECNYDPVSKVFSRLFLMYDNFRFDLSYKKCTIFDIKKILKLYEIDVFKYVRDNVKLNKATLEQVNACITRWEND